MFFKILKISRRIQLCLISVLNGILGMPKINRRLIFILFHLAAISFQKKNIRKNVGAVPANLSLMS